METVLTHKEYTVDALLHRDNCFVVFDNNDIVIGRIIKKEDGYHVVGLDDVLPFLTLDEAAVACHNPNVRLMAFYHPFKEKCPNCGLNHYEAA